jgi:hypothetical protein
MSNENSLKRKEKRNKTRSFEETLFGATFIVFEKRTKKGKWVRTGRMRIR